MALVGTFSMGSIIPLLLAALVQVEGDAALLAARLEGLIALQANMALTPPSISADAVAALAAALQITFPALEVTAVASAILELEASLGSLNAFLAIGALLGVFGIHVYQVEGTANEMAAELVTDLSPGFPGSTAAPWQRGTGFFLVAATGSAEVALKACIRVGN